MNRDEIEHIRASSRIEEVIAAYLELKPSGHCLLARCPFHEDRTPSLAVFPVTQTWWCFGCGSGGDVFEFVKRIERTTFGEAIRILDGPTIAIQPRRPLPSHRDSTTTSPGLTPEHYALLTAATEVYHAALFTRPDLLAYLAQRGLDAEAIHRFRLGYASGHDLLRYLRYRGWNPEMASDLGLLGPYGEYFRERIVIPELRHGQAVYLIGRATCTGQKAKYLGLPGAPKPLYGQACSRGADTLFLVEGPFDWLTLANWGLRSACLARQSPQARARARACAGAANLPRPG